MSEASFIDKETMKKLNNFELKRESRDENSKECCMLCLERKSDAVILECGHANICFFCAFKVYRTHKLCHLCR